MPSFATAHFYHAEEPRRRELQDPKTGGDMEDAELTRELETVVEEFTQAWNGMDFKALRALWDPDLSEPVYVPEESDRLVGWDAVEHYWQEVERTQVHVRVIPRDLVCRRLSTDTALASFSMHVEWLLVHDAAPSANTDVRVSLILRSRRDGWKAVHYVEAPIGALPMVRRFYQRNVTPEFAELARREPAGS
jgi:ketosteroid isomerase-like protein